MELTVEQALQQGVAAHKEGKLEEAERLYRAIMQTQPLHPDANHNLGVLAVSMNKTDVALPLFKTALEANPKIEQFWFSYIDALIKKKQFDNANQVLEKAKKQGVDGERLNSLEAQLLPKNQKPNIEMPSPPEELLNSLLEHYQNRRYDDAEKLALFLSRKFPSHNLSWKILGGVLKKTDRVSEAVFAGERAIEIAPNDAEAHYNLGNTFQELGKLDQAEASYKQAIALKSDYVDAYSNLGVTLQMLEKLDEAVASYNKAIALKPDYAEAHYNLGVALEELGRLGEAEASYNKAIALKPNYAEAHYNLGVTQQILGKLDEADASYRQAIALKPDYVEAHSNLGNALKDLRRLDEAEASYRHAIMLEPNFSEIHNNLGATLQEMDRLDEAEASYRKAITLKPNDAEAYLNLCELLEKMNRADELLSFIRSDTIKILEKKADFLYYEALTEFRKENYDIAADVIEKININELLDKRQQPALKLQGDISHHKKNYSAAFEAYNSKNKQIKDSLEYKRLEPEKYFIQQKEKVTQIEQLNKQSAYKSGIKPNWIQPTFLIGFPRSGTTLLDTILRTHSNIDVLEELPMLEKMNANFGDIPTISKIEAMDNKEAEIASGFYFKELKNHIEISKKQILIDKLPLNILQLPLINQVFPNAKYIVALRHPLDCVLSCWIQNFNLNPAMANMMDLERIADFYDVAMSILKHSEKRYSLDTHKVRYEDLVLDFKENVSNLLTFLDLKWEEELRSYQKTALARGRIKTPSSSQVIKPLYQTASYRWKHYEEHLEKYKTRLMQWIEEYGY